VLQLRHGQECIREINPGQIHMMEESPREIHSAEIRIDRWIVPSPGVPFLGAALELCYVIWIGHLLVWVAIR